MDVLDHDVKLVPILGRTIFDAPRPSQVVNLRNLQKTPENFVDYPLDNYLSMPHNRYIKETEQTFYQKLLPICYQKVLTRSSFSAIIDLSAKVDRNYKQRKQNDKHYCWLTVHHPEVWRIRHSSGSNPEQERHKPSSSIRKRTRPLDYCKVV